MVLPCVALVGFLVHVLVTPLGLLALRVLGVVAINNWSKMSDSSSPVRMWVFPLIPSINCWKLVMLHLPVCIRVEFVETHISAHYAICFGLHKREDSSCNRFLNHSNELAKSPVGKAHTARSKLTISTRSLTIKTRVTVITKYQIAVDQVAD